MIKLSKIIKRVCNIENIEYLILSLIILLGLIVRLYKIENPLADWHSWRQADTASVTKNIIERGVNVLDPRYHDISTVQTGVFNPEGYRLVEFPIYNLIHSAFAKTFPGISLEIWGRLTSVIFALISTVLLFLIGKAVLDKWRGLLAAFFYVTIPFNIYFTRVILPEPVAVSLALTSLFLFIKFINNSHKVTLYFSALFLALSLLIKPFLIFYGVPMIYLILKKYNMKEIINNSKLVINFLIFALISLAPFFFWRIWINRHPEGIPFYWWMFNGDAIRFKPSFWKWLFAERLGSLILGAWGLIPFSAGIFSKNKNYFNLWFIIGVFFYVSLVATANVRHDYYQIIIIPAIALVLAEGTFFLWKSKYLNKILSRLVLILSLGVMFIAGATSVREFYKINHPEILLAGSAVDRLTPKNALIIAPYNGDTAFLYQTKRWGWPFVDRPIGELVDSGADFYVSVNYDDQTNEFIQKYDTLERTEKFIILDLHKPKLK